jgi:uncharacterized repeat protein (TIGR01451 family)
MKHYFFLLVCVLVALELNSQNWKSLDGPTGVKIVYSVITQESNEILVLTASDQVFLSEDSGINWQEISTGIITAQNSVNGKIAESLDGKIFMYLGKNFYQYDGSNRNWILRKSNIELLDFTIGTNGYIYGGSRSEFYISQDDGLNFDKKADWSTSDLQFICKGSNTNYVLRSVGHSYTIFSFDDDGTNLNPLGGLLYSDAFVYHQQSDNFVNVSYGQMYLTKDKGLNWIKLKIAGFESEYLRFILERPDGSLLAIGSHFFISIDGGLSWQIEPGYSSNNGVIRYASITKNLDVLTGNLFTGFLTQPTGIKHELSIPINKPTITDFTSFGETGLVCVANGKTQFSLDDGVSWKTLREDIPVFSSGLENIDRYGNYYVFGNDSLRIFNFLTENLKVQTYPFYPFVNYENSLVTQAGKLIIENNSDYYISHDKGMTWIQFNTDYPIRLANANCSATDVLYVATQDSIHYSLDYGVTWAGFEAFGVDDFQYIFLSRNNVFYWVEYSGSDPAMFSSADFGNSFKYELGWAAGALLFVDENGTKYVESSNKLLFYHQNVIDPEIFEHSGLDSIPWYEDFYLGDNGYLYCAQPNKLLYKSTRKVYRERSHVTGKVITDDNLNCIKDPTDNYQQQWSLQFVSAVNQYHVTTNFKGEYSFSPAAGEYTVSLSPGNLLWLECDPAFKVKIETTGDTALNDFLVKPLELCPVLKTDISMSRLRRCFENNSATVNICNTGTEDAVDTKVYIGFDALFENITSIQTPASTNGNSWYYDLPLIKRGKCIKLQFTFKVSCNASLGDMHCIRAISENAKVCNSILPLIDTSIICSPNLGSFDPNDKAAFVNDIEEEKSILQNQKLTYLIRFQNTGTDTAFRVVVKDKLSSNLDWSSFEMLSASHDYEYILDSYGNLEVIFDNIMLPDSNINSLASNGFFKYEIKQKPDLKPGTVIFNDAAIYFDYNTPVLTNLTQLKVNSKTATKDFNKNVYELLAVPNPFRDETVLMLPKEFDSQVKRCAVFDVSGNRVFEFTSRDHNLKLSSDVLANGFYIVHVITDKNLRAVGKILINK